MKDRQPQFLGEIADYYAGKLAEHGLTPRGVDWNGEESQTLRFRQLSKIIAQPAGFSINDLGCGYGALLDFLRTEFQDFSYTGIDLSAAMIDAARQRFRHRTSAGSNVSPNISSNVSPDSVSNADSNADSNAGFVLGGSPGTNADYGIASGIFNVKLECDDAAWLDYIVRTLDVLNETSARGFSFNCLTSYSDADKKRPDLYYADPCHLFDLCKRNYSRHVALLHDYGLYEFTILVRKP